MRERRSPAPSFGMPYRPACLMFLEVRGLLLLEAGKRYKGLKVSDLEGTAENEQPV